MDRFLIIVTVGVGQESEFETLPEEKKPHFARASGRLAALTARRFSQQSSYAFRGPALKSVTTTYYY
jgi:hypothetical protein